MRDMHHASARLHVLRVVEPQQVAVPLLQLVDFPDAFGPRELHYDAEWLAVLRTTHQLMSLQRRPVTLPGV